MSLLHWKTIKWLVLFFGGYVGLQAINAGADPLTVMVIIAVLWGGPDALEYLAVSQQDFQDYQDRYKEREREEGGE